MTLANNSSSKAAAGPGLGAFGRSEPPLSSWTTANGVRGPVRDLTFSARNVESGNLETAFSGPDVVLARSGAAYDLAQTLPLVATMPGWRAIPGGTPLQGKLQGSYLAQKFHQVRRVTLELPCSHTHKSYQVPSGYPVAAYTHQARRVTL